MIEIGRILIGRPMPLWALGVGDMFNFQQSRDNYWVVTAVEDSPKDGTEPYYETLMINRSQRSSNKDAQVRRWVGKERNHEVMSYRYEVTPYVGQAVTYCINSDCYPYTVVEVGLNWITIQADEIKRDADGNLVFTPNIKAETKQLCLNRNGQWVYRNDRRVRVGLVFGKKEWYLDPSF